MRRLLSFTLLFLSGSAFARTSVEADTSKQVDSLNFCNYKIKVPPGCDAPSPFQIECGNFALVWLYLDPANLKTMPDMVVTQMAGQYKGFRKEAITCYLHGTEASGYKISFFDDQGIKHYQVLGYGTVNRQPVLVELSLSTDPKKNEDIPAFPRQIVRLTK